MSKATTSEAYKKQALSEYKAERYRDAISSFEKAIALGDRSLFIYDCKVAAMSRAEKSQEIALHAIAPIIQKFSKHPELYKLYYRKADILCRQQAFSLALDAITQSKLLVAKSPARDRPRALQFVEDRRQKIIALRQAHVTKRAKENKEEAIREAEQKERYRRTMYRKQTNFYATMLSADILILICEHGLKVDSNMACRMGGVHPFWRRSIHTQPRLWSELTLGKKKPVEKAELWRARSLGRVRHLVFSSSFEEKRCGEVLEALDTEKDGSEPVFDHIQHLEVESGRDQGQHRSLDFRRWKGKCTRLRSVRLDGVLCAGLDLDLCANPAATLEQVHMSVSLLIKTDGGPGVEPVGASTGNDDASGVAQKADTPWLALKKLSFTRSSRDEGEVFYTLLPSLTSLEELDISTSYVPPPFSLSMARPPPQTVTLTKLQRFWDDGAFGDNGLFPPCHRAAYAIHAPNLVDLAMRNFGGRTMMALDHPLLDLSKLVSLDVTGGVLFDDSFAELAEELTSLRFLNVSGCGLTDEFLKAISHVDTMEDTILPKLEALSIAQSTVTTRGVRDFVDSRLPPKKRMAPPRKVEPPKKTAAGAFRPAKREKPMPTATPIIASTSTSAPVSTQRRIADALTADLDITVFSTQPGLPSVRPSINWLCLDHCDLVSYDVVLLLQRHVAYVSAWNGTPMPERQSGKGRWRWDSGIASCIDDGREKCYMRKEGDLWTAQHYCEASGAAEAIRAKEKEPKGWWREGEMV